MPRFYDDTLLRFHDFTLWKSLWLADILPSRVYRYPGQRTHTHECFLRRYCPGWTPFFRVCCRPSSGISSTLLYHYTSHRVSACNQLTARRNAKLDGILLCLFQRNGLSNGACRIDGIRTTDVGHERYVYGNEKDSPFGFRLTCSSLVLSCSRSVKPYTREVLISVCTLGRCRAWDASKHKIRYLEVNIGGHFV